MAYDIIAKKSWVVHHRVCTQQTTVRGPFFRCSFMGVSENRGTPKWMVYNGKPYETGMIWGYHYFSKHPYSSLTTDFKPALWVSKKSPSTCIPLAAPPVTGHQPWGRYVKSIGPAALAGYFLGVAGVLGQQAGKGKRVGDFTSNQQKHVEQRSPFFFAAGGGGGCWFGNHSPSEFFFAWNDMLPPWKHNISIGKPAMNEPMYFL